MTQSPLNVLEYVVKAADSKNAEDIIALDVANVSLLADYFVILHANNDRQLNAITESILNAAEENHQDVRRVEGKNDSKWILVDLGDVIVHMFSQDERELYKLERLWSDAEQVDISKWLD